MEDDGEKSVHDMTPAFSLKSQKTTAKSDNVGDEFVMDWFSMDDEMETELWKLLETETVSPVPEKVRFVADPYSSLLLFQSSSSYVTINGNDESCGSSFSESDSSVMASVDMGSIRGDSFSGDGGAWIEDAGEARGWMEVEKEAVAESRRINGWCDEWDDYDAMLAKFLGEDLSNSQ